MSRTAWRIAGILAAVYVLGALPGLAQFSAAQSGRVVSLRGNIALKRARLDPLQIHLNDAVAPGDELITDQNSEAVIKASDGSTVRIFPSSRVLFNEHSGDVQEFLHLFLGSVKIHIEKLSGRPNPQKTTTPTAVIAVRGTTFSVFVDDADTTLVAVEEGIVGVANIQTPGEEVLLHRGQRTWVRPGQHPLQAQRFRGRSERADTIPAGKGNSAMNGQGMSGAATGGMGAMSSEGHGARGMMGRPGPPH
jgi:ferric-dicitrate binding protein FerR (iron transport regulator)